MRTILTGAIRVAVSPNAGAPSRHVQHNPSAPRPLGTDPRAAVQAIARRQFDYFGAGFIAGVVTVEDVPARRLVRLLDAKTARVVASAFSDTDGKYRFEQLNLSRDYVVLAHDYTLQFNAVVADAVRAVLPLHT